MIRRKIRTTSHMTTMNFQMRNSRTTKSHRRKNFRRMSQRTTNRTRSPRCWSRRQAQHPCGNAPA